LPDNTVTIYFYINDFINPAYVENSATPWGFNVIEINTGQRTTLGYFDDFSFALSVPPNLSVSSTGANATVAWPGSGWTLQVAGNVLGPWSDLPGATSGFTTNTASGPAQLFFRLKN
jgi:hypothetical protein